MNVPEVRARVRSYPWSKSLAIINFVTFPSFVHKTNILVDGTDDYNGGQIFVENASFI